MPLGASKVTLFAASNVGDPFIVSISSLLVEAGLDLQILVQLLLAEAVVLEDIEVQ